MKRFCRKLPWGLKVLAIILSGLFIFLLFWANSSKTGLNNSNWFGFWGACVGSVLGVIATLIAFRSTYKQNESQYIETKEQYEASQKATEEWNRLQSLPFINVEPGKSSSSVDDFGSFSLDTTGMYEKSASPNPLLDQMPVLAIDSAPAPAIDPASVPTKDLIFIFSNIGVAPAINVKVSSNLIGHIPSGKQKRYTLYLPQTTRYIPDIQVTYEDREKRKYRQALTLSYEDSKPYTAQITPPKLENSGETA